MAMAAVAVCKPFSSLPYAALSTRQRIKNDYQSQECFINASCKDFHQKRGNSRPVYVQALRPKDGGKEKRNNKEGGGANTTDEPSCAEIPKSMFLGSPNRPEPVKGEEQQQQQLSAGKEKKPEPCGGRLVHDLPDRLEFQKHAATTSRDQELKKHQRQKEFAKNSKQQPDARCRLRSLWHTVSRPQNLLAAFLTGLLLYAIALFGWQVMVVAVDVTLFVLKCSLFALVLLVMYIFLI